MSNELTNYYSDDTDLDDWGLSELADLAGRDLADKDEQIIKLEAVNADLLEALEQLLWACDEIGDFKNGVSDSGIDEGRAYADREFLAPARAAIAKAKGVAK